MGQKDHVKAAMPSGLSDISSLLNFGSLGDYKGNVKSATKEVIEESSKGFNWWPWLIGTLLLFGALWAFKNCSDDVKEVGSDMKDATTAVVDSSANLPTDAASTIDDGLSALGSFFSRKLPNGIELNIPENGIENNLIKYLEDANAEISKEKWFNFDRITFETGSAKLSEESKEQVKNIAEILKAFPNVNIKIGGYTDNTGDAASNLKLSDARSKSVLNAIISESIAATRLEAEGYGQEHPAASNDTEEGRKQNRRIAVRVTKK
jgi:OmpA-OmpF porin, OOP family